jgi:dTDP-4-dehydrorhamnose reductase
VSGLLPPSTELIELPRGPLAAVKEPLALVFGAGGLLGQALSPALLLRDVRICRPTRDEVDIADLDAVATALDEERPHLVVNLAALSDPERCAADPEQAYRVNAVGPHNLALCCARAGVPLVQLSCDRVFAPRLTGGYDEVAGGGRSAGVEDVLGRSKWIGEQLVRRHHAEHLIVRTGPLFGAGSGDLLEQLAAAPREAPRIWGGVRRCPCWTVEVAEMLVALAQTACWGTYHAVGEGVCGADELAHAATDREPPRSDEDEPVAPGLRLESPLSRARGLHCVSPWRRALARYLRAS